MLPAVARTLTHQELEQLAVAPRRRRLSAEQGAELVERFRGGVVPTPEQLAAIAEDLVARPGVRLELRRRGALELYRELVARGLRKREAARLAGRRFHFHERTIRRW